MVRLVLKGRIAQVPNLPSVIVVAVGPEDAMCVGKSQGGGGGGGGGK